MCRIVRKDWRKLSLTLNSSKVLHRTIELKVKIPHSRIRFVWSDYWKVAAGIRTWNGWVVQTTFSPATSLVLDPCRSSLFSPFRAVILPLNGSHWPPGLEAATILSIATNSKLIWSVDIHQSSRPTSWLTTPRHRGPGKMFILNGLSASLNLLLRNFWELASELIIVRLSAADRWRGRSRTESRWRNFWANKTTRFVRFVTTVEASDSEYESDHCVCWGECQYLKYELEVLTLLLSRHLS